VNSQSTSPDFLAIYPSRLEAINNRIFLINS
jgi:hypothetical protein